MRQAHPDKDLVVLILSKRVNKNTTPFVCGHVLMQWQVSHWPTYHLLQSRPQRPAILLVCARDRDLWAILKTRQKGSQI